MFNKLNFETFYENHRKKQVQNLLHIEPGDQPVENCFITHPPAQSNKYQNIYFQFKKRQTKYKKTNKQEDKKQNKLKKKRVYLWKI